jgi:hypothetical protein
MWIDAGGIVPLPRAGGALSHTAANIRNLPGTVKHLTRHPVTMAELNQGRRDDRMTAGVERVTGPAEPTAVRVVGYKLVAGGKVLEAVARRASEIGGS